MTLRLAEGGHQLVGGGVGGAGRRGVDDDVGEQVVTGGGVPAAVVGELDGVAGVGAERGGVVGHPERDLVGAGRDGRGHADADGERDVVAALPAADVDAVDLGDVAGATGGEDDVDGARV